MAEISMSRFLTVRFGAVLVLTGVLGILSAPAVPTAGAAAKYNPNMHPAEWRYIDVPNDAIAGKMLEKLVKKYNTPKKCDGLVKKLRRGRGFLGKLPKKETVTRKCADGLEREFTYYIPAKYNAKRKHGLLIFLHGAISQGPPGGGEHEARDIGGAVDSLRYVKIGPSTYDRHEWSEEAVREHINYALDYVKQRFNVDENRVYIAGDSDGGRGTYAAVETEATYVAAAVPVIGSPGGVTRFANLRNIPWFAINGEKDSLFKIEHVRGAVEAMKKAGFDFTWKLVEGGGHDPFFFTKYKKEVCDFLKKHPRTPLPEVAEWQIDPYGGPPSPSRFRDAS